TSVAPSATISGSSAQAPEPSAIFRRPKVRSRKKIEWENGRKGDRQVDPLPLSPILPFSTSPIRFPPWHGVCLKLMRVKKWFLRILLVVLILPLLLLAAVQVVLWTDLPRNWVISAVQEKLQLRVSAASFSTAWSGQTSLSNVTLSLPLAQESFLQAPRVSVGHTNLLALLIGRPLRVEAIEIDRPNLL